MNASSGSSWRLGCLAFCSLPVSQGDSLSLGLSPQSLHAKFSSDEPAWRPQQAPLPLQVLWCARRRCVHGHHFDQPTLVIKTSSGCWSERISSCRCALLLPSCASSRPRTHVALHVALVEPKEVLDRMSRNLALEVSYSGRAPELTISLNQHR